MRLAAEEAARASALVRDIQHGESREPSAEIRLVRRPTRVLE
jgi:hypothetical protein